MKTKKQVTLKPGRYYCYREDGFGDTGMFLTSRSLKNHFKVVGKNGMIKVGARVFCGNFNTWILTSEVTEILEVNKDKTEAKIKTLNSIYTIKVS